MQAQRAALVRASPDALVAGARSRLEHIVTGLDQTLPAADVIEVLMDTLLGVLRRHMSEENVIGYLGDVQDAVETGLVPDAET